MIPIIPLIGVGIALIGIGIAAWAAWEARRAADASKKSIEAQIVYTAMTEYFGKEMVSNLRILRDWKDKYKDNFATKWWHEFKEENPEAKKVDAARRQVKGFFVKAERLHSNKIISDSALKAVAHVHGIDIFYDIVCPLDKKLNPNDPIKTETYLVKNVGRYEQK